MILSAGGWWWVVGGGPGGAGPGPGVLEVGVVKLSLLTQKSGRYLDVIKMGLSKNRGREYWLVKISAR